MKKLSEIFNFWYGVNLELVNCEVSSAGIPFVSRTSNNNGVVARVSMIDGITPNPSHTLSLAGGGSVLSCFYQDEPYYSGRDLFVLSPKEKMSKKEMILYSYIISSNKYRYNYGRQANKSFQDLMLPEIGEIKHLMKDTISADYSFKKESILPSTINFDSTQWKWFDLISDRLFRFNRGTRLTKADSTIGNTPLVTAGKENQGIKRYVDNTMDTYSNCITIDMFGYCVYREYKFCCDDNILVLQPNENLSKYTLLFIATIINQDSYKCTYGRQYRQKTLQKHKIKLPIDSDGNPDWGFMENYIKSLPYSANI